MATIIELNAWRERKAAQIELAPALTWRIDAEGNMLRGIVGRHSY